MALPSQRRAEALEKAGKARDFLITIDSVRDLTTRATVLHDRIADSVREICGESADVFNEDQIALLSDIAVHITLLMDPHQKKPTKGFARLRHEFGELSAMDKLAKAGIMVSLVIGFGTIASWGYIGAVDAWHYAASQSVAEAGVQPTTKTSAESEVKPTEPKPAPTPATKSN